MYAWTTACFCHCLYEHLYVHVQYVQSMWVFGPCVWVRLCGLEAMESRNTELTGGRRDLGRGAKEAKETRVCRHTHTHTGIHTHIVLWSRGASALVRVTGIERSIGLKSITTATASHNPIPSHPIHELCATWLACSPWGAEATAQALSAYSLCQLWLWVCGRGASSALKERLLHFGKRRCELCRRTPTVSVCLCVRTAASVSPSWGTVWGE